MTCLESIIEGKADFVNTFGIKTPTLTHPITFSSAMTNLLLNTICSSYRHK